jgi:hypothetical protein
MGFTRRLAWLAALFSLTSTALAEERPFLFAEDARTPNAGQVDGYYRVTWGISPGGMVRPIGSANLGLSGAMHEIGGEVGLFSRLSLRAYGLGQMELGTGNTEFTGGAELRARVIGSVDGPFQLTLGAGVLREFTGDANVQGRVVGSGGYRGFRATADVLVEHSFRPMSDGVDMIITAGVSYAILPFLRAGVEYVGQDVEAAVNPDEIEGARHLVGPTLAINLLHERLQFVGGPAFGLTPISPHAVVRLGIIGTL